MRDRIDGGVYVARAYVAARDAFSRHACAFDSAARKHDMPTRRAFDAGYSRASLFSIRHARSACRDAVVHATMPQMERARRVDVPCARCLMRYPRGAHHGRALICARHAPFFMMPDAFAFLS